MIRKSTILILVLFLISHFLSAQEYATSVSLVSNSLNKAHPFYDILIKKDQLYIQWLYFHCKGQIDEKKLKNSINRPLVFSLKQGGVEVLDTIQNYVHPKLYENEREQEWKSEIPLYGSFPEYINFHLTNDPNSSAFIDLAIHRTIADIKIYVLTEEGELVSTITDKTLKQGRHRFHWFTQDIKSGTYLLFTEIDSQLTIHSVRVEKNWFANIFSRDKEISRKTRIVTKNFEMLDRPILEGEYHYIQMNRFGTSLGLNLSSDAEVKVELFSIQGKYITTVQDRKFQKGITEILMDPFVKKQGWYLAKLSIDDTSTHLKLKIKK